MRFFRVVKPFLDYEVNQVVCFSKSHRGLVTVGLNGSKTRYNRFVWYNSGGIEPHELLINKNITPLTREELLDIMPHLPKSLWNDIEQDDRFITIGDTALLQVRKSTFGVGFLYMKGMKSESLAKRAPIVFIGSRNQCRKFEKFILNKHLCPKIFNY